MTDTGKAFAFQSFEEFLREAGWFLVFDGQAVLSGRVYSVMACDHEGCEDGRHARLENA